jgi:hypothetical protein
MVEVKACELRGGWMPPSIVKRMTGIKAERVERMAPSIAKFVKRMAGIKAERVERMAPAILKGTAGQKVL